LGRLWREQGSTTHLSRIWDEELSLEGVRILSIDPGDMDTPLHAAAVPDADRSTLKSPEVAARELTDTVAAVLSLRASDSDPEAIAQEVIG
jgi:NAD(P)-dependent dehydrogenase (short-subunit alcohol dehydrogenase family)